ncbi:molybdopterin-binding oxidoreductase [Mangrovactinospora gilvigrisea]|uniref:Molybdopterin-binding oxidoreductase n=1 Tax=Mangrovactinospora gilvigrisea TaxID=1428644 RepID=A0A1J7BDJ6_9ACTN|nr:molybdopterin-binding oxidoreductase [Mangrovactinospora gilvigrisea]
MLAGAAALGVGELIAGLVRPQASPWVAVGRAAIDMAPAPVKNWAINNFGTGDKLALQIGILVVVAILAAVLGRLGWAIPGTLVLGALGVAAALTRPDATGWDAAPTIVGVGAGLLTIKLLRGQLVAEDGGIGRRRFLSTAAGVVVASAGATAIGRYLDSTRTSGTVARETVHLPRPASPARPLPPSLPASFTTPTSSFYRVDTALVTPQVSTKGWTLRIHGTGVTKPLTLTYADLLARPLIERYITIACVSNTVGGPYIGNARWLGVRLADVLREAGVRPPSKGGRADQLVARSTDGMTIGTPVETVMDGRDALLAVGMDGQPLPVAHGFPVRMVVPGLYGYVSACKWLSSLELTTFSSYNAYWVTRGWSQQAVIKTESRIDTPHDGSSVSAAASGGVTVAGVAWAQHRGISRVELRADKGPWTPATLLPAPSADTWRMWRWTWHPAAKGDHTLQVRATDRTGTPQTSAEAAPEPNGATGYHTINVTVG